MSKSKDSSGSSVADGTRSRHCSNINHYPTTRNKWKVSDRLHTTHEQTSGISAKSQGADTSNLSAACSSNRDTGDDNMGKCLRGAGVSGGRRMSSKQHTTNHKTVATERKRGAHKRMSRRSYHHRHPNKASLRNECDSTTSSHVSEELEVLLIGSH